MARENKYFRTNKKDRRPVQGTRVANRESITYETDAGSHFTDDEIEFMLAMDSYKRDNRRPFPTWHEVLTVVKALGYRKKE